MGTNAAGAGTLDFLRNSQQVCASLYMYIALRLGTHSFYVFIFGSPGTLGGQYACMYLCSCLYMRSSHCSTFEFPVSVPSFANYGAGQSSNFAGSLVPFAAFA